MSSLYTYFFLLTFFLFSSCSDSNKELTYLHEKPITISGEIKNYDKEEYLQSIQFGFTQVWNQMPYSDFVFLDENGRFELRISNSLIQDYTLLYGGKIQQFVATPGDSIHFIIERVRSVQDEDKGELKEDQIPYEYVFTTENRRTQQSMDLMKKLYEGYDPLRSTTDMAEKVDSFRRVVPVYINRLTERLDSIWNVGNYTDEKLYDFALQEITFKNKNFIPSLLFFHLYMNNKNQNDSLINISKYTPPDSLLAILEEPKNFDEGLKKVYSSWYIHTLTLSEMVYNLYESNENKKLYRNKEFDAIHRNQLQIIEDHFSGIQKDILLARYFSRTLSSKAAITDDLKSRIDSFVQHTPVESFARVIQTKASHSYDQSDLDRLALREKIVDLPDDVENILSNILDRFKGKVVVMDFWATWCTPCLLELKNQYPTMVKRYDKKDVAFLFLASSSSPEGLWLDYISKFNFEASHYLLTKAQDETMKVLFDVNAIPHLVVFDRQGKLVRNLASRPGHGLEEMIESLL